MQHAVDAVPARRPHARLERGQVLGQRDVELDDLTGHPEAGRDAGGDAVPAADRRREQHVGPLRDGEPHDGAGERGLGEHPRGQQAPAGEQPAHAPFCSNVLKSARARCASRLAISEASPRPK